MQIETPAANEPKTLFSTDRPLSLIEGQTPVSSAFRRWVALHVMTMDDRLSGDAWHAVVEANATFGQQVLTVPAQTAADVWAKVVVQFGDAEEQEGSTLAFARQAVEALGLDWQTLWSTDRATAPPLPVIRH